MEDLDNLEYMENLGLTAEGIISLLLVLPEDGCQTEYKQKALICFKRWAAEVLTELIRKSPTTVPGLTDLFGVGVCMQIFGEGVHYGQGKASNN